MITAKILLHRVYCREPLTHSLRKATIVNRWNDGGKQL